MAADMNIAIYGYGRMGRMVEESALDRGHSVSLIFDVDRPLEDSALLKGADAIISFSLPEAVIPMLKVAAAAGVPVVEGTTGWYDQLDEVRNIPGLSMVYSPNFSIGVYLFAEIVREAALRLGNTEGYDTYIHELHHSGKADSPSGTANHLADIVLESVPGKHAVQSESSHGKIDSGLLHVTSTRAGRFPGTHEVGFDCEADLIQLKHTAHGRKGFARGAVQAAEWIVGRDGIFSMRDFMQARD